MNHYDRRKFLAGVAGAGIAGLTLPRVAFATTERDQRFVFVILRVHWTVSPLSHRSVTRTT
jgi:hypothetical protein